MRELMTIEEDGPKADLRTNLRAPLIIQKFTLMVTGRLFWLQQKHQPQRDVYSNDKSDSGRTTDQS